MEVCKIGYFCEGLYPLTKTVSRAGLVIVDIQALDRA